MIKIIDKSRCCGCASCVQKCPKQCISLQRDEQGFLYPLVNLAECVDCKLCERVCPELNFFDQNKPIETLASYNYDNKVRQSSSSGGVFMAFAETIISQNGVVFGACFNKDWDVVFESCDSIEDLKKFRGSKYVQASIGNSFRECETFLKSGKPVLFSGTSCQIAGLKHFLLKDYPNLYTIDFVCHGVPSPMVWKDYLKTKVDNIENVTSIAFRDKTNGWNKFGLRISNKSEADYYGSLETDPYLRVFLNDLTLRPSCFDCPARNGQSNSDITIADFWRIEEFVPTLNDDKGISMILVRSKKGLFMSNGLNVFKESVDYRFALESNRCIEKSVNIPKDYVSFWESYSKKGINTLYDYSSISRESFIARLYKLYKKHIRQS